ncbi:hypothetical protein J3R30DRAFT_3551534 [Lentinula aciculospora]|uniref:Uncharacterized protein n=1 Tax=Lentinula aciculospora TaxID=153920 RepID=A0A9W8ZWX9_9AGAR|nr:hypothetical protein J3R30DRAFT_3551534 [Lentinula aciculospora]
MRTRQLLMAQMVLRKLIHLQTGRVKCLQTVLVRRRPGFLPTVQVPKDMELRINPVPMMETQRAHRLMGLVPRTEPASMRIARLMAKLIRRAPLMMTPAVAVSTIPVPIVHLQSMRGLPLAQKGPLSMAVALKLMQMTMNPVLVERAWTMPVLQMATKRPRCRRTSLRLVPSRLLRPTRRRRVTVGECCDAQERHEWVKRELKFNSEINRNQINCHYQNQYLLHHQMNLTSASLEPFIDFTK